MQIKKFTCLLLCSVIFYFYTSKSVALGSTYELTLEGYYYRYDEKNTPSNTFFMRDIGRLYGLNFNIENNFRLVFLKTPIITRFELGTGFTDNCKYKSNGTGSSNESNYTRVELRYLFFFPIIPSTQLYTGLGIRHLTNNDSDKITSTGHFGYFRHSFYSYLPLGLRYQFPEYKNMKLSCRAAYNHILYARQYSDVMGGVFNYQPDGFGLSFSLDFIRPLRCFDLIGGIFLRYWDIEDSETVHLFWHGRSVKEPKNTTLEPGLHIGIRF